MEEWVSGACNYIASWLEFHMRLSRLPGCIVVVMHRDQIVFERAYGFADLATGEALTPRHRFRIASHSKAFTAAGIMRLREAGKLRLDDPIDQYVKGLHPQIGEATISQLLSHSAGLVRDGADAGFFEDRRPFPTVDQLMADLQDPPVIEPNTRHKYSNHGFGLLGLAIGAITGEPYRSWIKREIVEAAGLEETEPDVPIADGVLFARGHTGELLLGKRLVIPGDYTLNAVAPAGGFVSTASDLAKYFAQLAPDAPRSALSAGSRREMIRRHWRSPHLSIERYYGLGIMSGNTEGWKWFGHGGGLQGYASFTCVVPERELTVSILTNASDGWAGYWVEGALHILRRFATRGAPSEKVRDWAGRWWNLWGAVDLVPVGDGVLVANPWIGKPLLDASEIEITGQDEGRIALASGGGSHGERVQRTRDAGGAVREVWLAATRFVTEAEAAAEMESRYAARGV
ncbi:MAG: beta-lactamase family protein [Alphaproteobacteria bacterium]|nr:beta-lactamase family protein [Alphaproteobacteria bacterium]